METIDKMLATPSWAYDACYVFPAIAAIMILAGLVKLGSLFFLPAATKKMMPFLLVVIIAILDILVIAFFGIMYFSICRGALKPTKEKFAVACKSTDDCTAVNGTPQGGECQCGARGVCGGCIMQNNMEPQQSFNDQFLPGYVA